MNDYDYEEMKDPAWFNSALCYVAGFATACLLMIAERL